MGDDAYDSVSKQSFTGRKTQAVGQLCFFVLRMETINTTLRKVPFYILTGPKKRTKLKPLC